jgi:hypothetical protein
MAANPDLPRILSLWNLLENKYLMQTVETVPLLLPAIKVNRKLGIPIVDKTHMNRKRNMNLGPVKVDHTKQDGFESVDSQSESLLLNVGAIDRSTHVLVRILSS